MPGKIPCIRCEQLVEQTERTVKALLDHCGLAFEGFFLCFFEDKRPVRAVCRCGSRFMERESDTGKASKRIF
jgi:hypothetical protein